MIKVTEGSETIKKGKGSITRCLLVFTYKLTNSEPEETKGKFNNINNRIMGVTKKVLQRKEKAINYQAVKKIRIVSGIRSSNSTTIFAGFDMLGKSVYGKPGDEFNVPEDISKDSAISLLISNFAVPVDEFAKAEKYIPEATRPRKVRLREEVPIELIRITGSGARTKKTEFFLGNSDGKGLTGKVGDYFSVKDGEITEELAKKLISKGFAEVKKKQDTVS